MIDGGTFVTVTDIVRLESVEVPEKGTPHSGMAVKKLESLVLDQTVRYTIRARDENGRAVSQVWVDNLNVNQVMKEYIKGLPRFFVYP